MLELSRQLNNLPPPVFWRRVFSSVMPAVKVRKPGSRELEDNPNFKDVSVLKFSLGCYCPKSSELSPKPMSSLILINSFGHPDEFLSLPEGEKRPWFL